jgi:hypothetical protein
MADQSPKRGALPTPANVFAAAKRYVVPVPAAVPVEAPPNFIRLPKQISFWGNFSDGDCVTAEEAFAKACNKPEIFIPDNVVIAWATENNVLNGAYLTQVMTIMQTAGFAESPFDYDDGPYVLVDFTNAATLQGAIFEGPVKLGVAGNQLDTLWWASGGSAAGGKSGWFATGFAKDTDYDHCVSLCGYGTISCLAQQLNVQVPAGVDGTKPGYAMFTWDSIGIIDVPSMIAITNEAWLRQPTTETTMTTWPAGKLINGTDPTPQSPASTVFNNQLYVFWKANDASNRIYYSASSSGTTWPAGKVIDGTDKTPDSLTAAVFNNQLYVFWKANDASNQIYYSASSNGTTWPAGKVIDGTDSTPDALTAAVFNNQLYVFWKANDASNRIYYSASPDGTTWATGQTINGTDSTPDSLAAAVLDDQLVLFWKANDASNRIYYSASCTGTSWPAGQTINGTDSTPDGMAAVVFNNQLFLFWKANDASNRIFFSSL